MNKNALLSKTKIICTLGPASNSYEVIKSLAVAGMDMVRLNFSYGTYDEFSKIISLVRKVENEISRPIGILQDLQGPRIRLGRIPEEIHVKPNAMFVFDSGAAGSGAVPVQYAHMRSDLKPGHRIIIGDGALTFCVETIDLRGVHAVSLSSGVLKSYRGVHFPDSPLQIGTPTRKDLQDFRFGLRQGVDYVALSFVQGPNDLKKLRREIPKGQAWPRLISKIERREAVERLDEILEAGDGTLVARGDLGVEMGLEEIPLLQKKIIRRASYFGKPVITATQMLESMIEKDSPTRAEVTDVANAVIDGTDAVLLSGETAAGKYPLQSVEFLSKILRGVERDFDLVQEEAGCADTSATEAFSMAEAALDVSRRIKIDRIVAFTYSGSTAQRISKFRPPAWIIALTPTLEASRRMSLHWGVYPVQTRMIHSTDEMFQLAVSEIKKRKLQGNSKSIVIVAGLPMKKTGITNLLKVHEL